MPSPIQQIVTSDNAVALTNNTTANIGAPITLASGHTWMLSGQVNFTDTDDFTETTLKRAGISSTSANFPGLNSGQGFRDETPTTSGCTISVPVTDFIVALDADTSFYLMADASFTNGGKSAFGKIVAIPLN